MRGKIMEADHRFLAPARSTDPIAVADIPISPENLGLRQQIAEARQSWLLGCVDIRLSANAGKH
jgi:hypothetical protein